MAKSTVFRVAEIITLLEEGLGMIEMLYHPKDKNRKTNRERWITRAKAALGKDK